MVKFNSDKLVIASHNKGKIIEISALLAGFNITVSAAGDHGISEIAETENTFAGNALLKARHVANATGIPALADDSGLCVHALDGAPGIYSARWAETENGCDFNKAMEIVANEIHGTENRHAYFICVLALVWPDNMNMADNEITVEGRVDGAITWPMRGDNGFGYDAIFQPDGYDISFAQMTSSQKDAISHRNNAFNKLIAACFK